MFIVNRNEIDPSVLNMTDEMIFEELKLYLESVGVDTYMVAAIGRSNSFMAKDIQTNIITDAKKIAQKPVMMFFMKNHTKISEELIPQIFEHWRDLLSYHI